MMKHLYLIREDYDTDRTLGTLYVNDTCERCYSSFSTLELPWRGNEKNISCIPAGEYKVIHYDSRKFPDTFEITNVKNRSKILIHQGNFPEDTSGCILIGKEVNEMGHLVSSRKALKELNELLEDQEEIKLIIE